MNAKKTFSLGALFAALAVALGAFGAHGLRNTLTPAALANFETGVRYQMYHALGLMAASWAMTQWQHRLLRWVAPLFSLGILVFSGSLYALSLTGIGLFGALAPIGGAALIAGWLVLALSVWKGQPSPR